MPLVHGGCHLAGRRSFLYGFHAALCKMNPPGLGGLKLLKWPGDFLFSFPNFVELAAIVGGSPERLPVCPRSVAPRR